ncbi:MAG: phospholipase D-like domain-containing protein [Actinobacteria bacterium]|nr:phospholipase D-like domain-containing protein [Actinomycetota bacterium]
MDEKDFLKLLIDTIRVEDYADKDKLIALLKLTVIRFEKTGEFTRHLWNHSKEYIQICIAPERLIELKKHKEYLYKICDEIYPANDDYEFWGLEIKPGAVIEAEEISQEIVFENIRNQIIEEIRNAKYVIWIVMAWFTDPVLFSELQKKKRQGVTIEIILDENEKNRNAGFDIAGEFPTHWMTIESYYKNIMHEKFCVIDLQTAVHGTFNWTKAASYNKEHISIDHNRATSEAFADEFMRLKREDVLSF